MPSQRPRSSFASFAKNSATLSSSRARATAAPVTGRLAGFATGTLAGGGVTKVRVSVSRPSVRSVILSGSVEFGTTTFTGSDTKPVFLPRYSVMNDLLWFRTRKIELVLSSAHPPPHSARRDLPHAHAVGSALLRLVRRTMHGNEAWLSGDPRSWLGVERWAPLFRVQPSNAPPPPRGPRKFPPPGFQNRSVDSRTPASHSLSAGPLRTVHG